MRTKSLRIENESYSVKGNIARELGFDGWLRYEYSSDNRYYVVLLQGNLFGGWTLIRIYGGKHNNLGGYKIEACEKYEDGVKRMKEIGKRRVKRGYRLIKEQRS